VRTCGETFTREAIPPPGRCPDLLVAIVVTPFIVCFRMFTPPSQLGLQHLAPLRRLAELQDVGLVRRGTSLCDSLIELGDLGFDLLRRDGHQRLPHARALASAQAARAFAAASRHRLTGGNGRLRCA